MASTGKLGDSARLHADELSLERYFEGVEVPEWNKQLTLRVLCICLIIGSIMTLLLMRLNLIISFILGGSIPPYALSLVILKAWTTIMDIIGIPCNPITRQEGAVMHSCLVGFFNIVYYGGFSSLILAMSELVAKQVGEGKDKNNWTTIRPGWMIMYLFLVNFIGLFTVIPAAEQLWLLLRSFLGSFGWGLLKWMYGGGPFCGIDAFPAFGLQAMTMTLYLSTSPAMIAIGLLCPHIVSFSYVLGGVLSWVLFWPFIKSKEGTWYPPGRTLALHGLYGYQILLTTAVLLGEGLFHVGLILVKAFYDAYLKKKPKGFIVPLHEHHNRHNTDVSMMANLSYDDRLRTKMFLKGHIPTPITIGGFLLTGSISAVAIPFIFPQLEPIHIAVAYIIAPVLNFCNSYGVGVSDFSFAPTYGRFAVLLFSGWIGLSQGGVLGGLVASSVVVAVMSPASDLIQNFKVAYMTLTSPRALVIAQAIGTAMGSVFGPIVFYYYYNSPNFGQLNSDYPADTARSYRFLAINATQGSGGLPRYALRFASIFFSVSLALNIAKELSKSMNLGLHPYVPNPIAMALPFFLSANFGLDVGLGSLILFVWNRVDSRHAALNVPTVASGFFAGDTAWTLCAAMLYKQVPPMCARFFSREGYMGLEKNLKKYPL